MGSFSTAVVVAFLCCLICASVTANCVTSSVESCNNQVMRLFRTAPTSAELVNAYCSQVSQLCSGTVDSCSCTRPRSALQRKCYSFLGYKAGIGYICSTEAIRSVFAANRQCIVTNGRRLMRTCRQQETCQGFNEAFRCFHTGMTSACNEATANMMVGFQLAKYGPALSAMSCTIDTSGYLP